VKRRPQWVYDAGLLYCALIWGSTFFIVKDVVAAVDPLAMVGYRFLISAAALAPWALRRPKPGKLVREGVVLGALLLLLYTTQTAGLRYTTASNSGFITGMFIFFVPLFLLVFFRQKPTAGQWAAVSLAGAGLWLLTGGISGINKGDALTLFAALAYAGHLLATDRYVRADDDTVLLAFHQFWFCGAASLVLCGAAGSPFAVPTVNAWGWILFLALLPNLSAFFIQMKAQRHTPPIKVGLIFSLEPVFAAVFAWTLGGEEFSGRRLAGGLLILAGMVLGELSKLTLKSGRKQEVLPV
jgi:drug/metabolite transporter (DMT)-like permease